MKLALVFFIVLLLKIVSQACSISQLSLQLQKQLPHVTEPQIYCEKFQTSPHSTTLHCANHKSITVNLEKNEFSFLTQTQKKFPFMSQCWVEGRVNAKCEILLKKQKCQIWNLNE